MIQHVLPHFMAYQAGMRNIGLFVSETTHFRGSGWVDRLELMDEVWVANRQQVDACRASGLTKEPVVIPHAVDVSVYEQSYPVLPRLKPFKEAGDFLFYFVGEYVRRKNLASLLKAFHLEFDVDEPVQLVIKTGLPGMSPAECEKHVLGDHQKTVEGLKLAHAKTPIVITERLSEQDVRSLHSTCDCLVSPSYGEAWGFPAMDAMGFGKVPVVTACGGFLDYIGPEEGFLVECREEPCFAAESLPGLYQGDECWWSIDIEHLRRCMRSVYGNARLRESRAFHGVQRVYDFSLEAVGNLIKKALLDGPATH